MGVPSTRPGGRSRFLAGLRALRGPLFEPSTARSRFQVFLPQTRGLVVGMAFFVDQFEGPASSVGAGVTLIVLVDSLSKPAGDADVVAPIASAQDVDPASHGRLGSRPATTLTTRCMLCKSAEADWPAPWRVKLELHPPMAGSDFYVPNVAPYQAGPHPDVPAGLTLWSAYGDWQVDGAEYSRRGDLGRSRWACRAPARATDHGSWLD